MNNKLILVEGIPGSGKSTIAIKIRDYLNSNNINARVYSEGDLHPADLVWCSYVPIKDYEVLLQKFFEYSDIIKEYTLIEDDYAIVAYTKLGFAPRENEMMIYFEEHEIYDGKVDLETFYNINMKRWSRFADNFKSNDCVYIFECAFLQNHLCELMGTRLKDNNYIINYFITLVKTATKLNPMHIYLSQQSRKETILRVAKERELPYKTKMEDWINLVINWVENSQYGKLHQLKGFDGVVKFMEDRKMIEMNVFDNLPIDKYIVNNTEYNWDEVFDNIKGILNENIL